MLTLKQSFKILLSRIEDNGKILKIILNIKIYIAYIKISKKTLNINKKQILSKNILQSTIPISSFDKFNGVMECWNFAHLKK